MFCRDALDTTVNYGAHVKFANRWLEKLEYEEKQANAPSQPEPGLVTEPALATEDSAPQNPVETQSASNETTTVVSDRADHDVVQEESAAACPAVQG